MEIKIMEELLIAEDIIAYIENSGLWTAMALLFIAAMIEYVFPPFPGDTVTLFGAFLVGTGIFPLIPIFLSIFLGSLSGTLMIYLMGQKLGKHYFAKKNFRFFPMERMHTLHDWYKRWGAWPIAVNRFIPAYRSLFILAAGIAEMNVWKVMLFSSVSIILWNGIIMCAGWLIGSNWNYLLDIFKVYTIAVISIVTMLFVLYLLIRRRRKKRDQKSDEK